MGYYGELQSGELNKKTKNIFQDINKIIMEVQETQDSFIFQTLSDFAFNNYHMIVEKQELIQAIQLIRMMREYGRSIDQRWTTATEQSEALSREYRRGYDAGVDSQYRKFIDILERTK